MIFNLLCVFYIVRAIQNPYGNDPFCFGKLIGKSIESRSFNSSDNCDMEPLAKPYKSFPPALYVIGAQKGGTSALTWLLQQNTVLDVGVRKEIRFLSFRPDYFQRMHSQDISYLEYGSLFSNSSGPTIDGSPGYHAYGGFFCQNLMFTLGVTRSEIPKMIFILRDPLSRLYSHWNMRHRWSSKKTHRLYNTKVPSLKMLIEGDLKKLSVCGLDLDLNDPNFNPRIFYNQMLMWCFHNFEVHHRTDMYLIKGLYAWQLEMIRRKANPNRVMVTCYDDFKADNQGFVSMVSKFVGLRVFKKGVYEPSRKSSIECPREYLKFKNLDVTPEYQQTLHKFFQKWNTVLVQDFGIDCGWKTNLDC